MSKFIEVKANKRSLCMRRPLNGVGINDAWYITEFRNGEIRSVCPYYSRWKDMISRCYSFKYHERQPTYIDCYVCDEWLTFSAFRLWMEKQDWEGNQLDKDIRVKNNKQYSPVYCQFVTKEINTLFMDCGSKRGELPQGVCFQKTTGKYMASISIRGNRKYIGLFASADAAHQAYKNKKNDYITEISNESNEPLKTELMAHIMR